MGNGSDRTEIRVAILGLASMDSTFFIVFVILAVVLAIVIGRELRKNKSKTAKTVSLSDFMTLKRREIKPRGVSKELLNQLLYAESEEKFNQVREEYPELRRYDEVGVPMHQALNMLMVTGKGTSETDKEEHIVMINEMQPGISSVVTETSDGKRIANLFEIPADILTEMMLVTPKDLQLDVAHSLQIGLHYPEYLTAESYWMLGEMATSANTPSDLKPGITRLHKALGICLEYGLDQEWILQVREDHQKRNPGNI